MLVKEESASQGESDRQRRLLKATRQQQRVAGDWLGDFVVIRLFSAVLFSASATPTVEIVDVVVTVLWAEEGGRTLKTE